jgi:hypothetical protein
MDYRDERDALRGRVDSLEEDLRGARVELAQRGQGGEPERIADLERQAAEARRLLERIEGELQQLRPPRPRTGSLRPALWLFGAASFVALLSVYVVVRRNRAPMPVVSPPPVSVLPPEPEPIATLPPVVTPPPPPPAEPPAPAHTSLVARWNARVTRSTGRAPAPGTACRIEATLARSKRGIRVDPLTVQCGAARIYDSTEALNGMAMMNAGAEERSGDRQGISTYLLEYEDKGARTGKRNQVSINSQARSASVWSDGAPAFHVDLSLPQESEPVTGEPLMDALAKVLRRAAVVSAVSGAAPLRVGARCDLRVGPIAADKCLARLTCGGAILYGKPGSGMTDCTLKEAAIVHVSDTEPTSKGGDPELDVDVAAGTLVLADEIRGARWSVTFGLGP